MCEAKTEQHTQTYKKYMNLLINTPDYSKPSSGGVASFYHGMLGYWHERVKYNVVGRRHGVSGALWLPFDVVKFVLALLFFRPDAVMVNPSLKRNALRRDFLFVRVARRLGFRVVVMLHGFDLQEAETIDKGWVVRHLNQASLVLTLAERFRLMMKEWGVTSPIALTTTKVEDRMIEHFDIQRRNGEIRHLLFLARVEKEKGVYELIDTFALLKQRHPELTLTVAGDGSEWGPLKCYAEERHIEGVNFTGMLNGEARIKAYQDADLFFFPSYGEGMPTVVLEAMAFGLPVITRYVGGLCDFFEDGKMGRITASLSPADFAALIAPLLADKALTQQISRYNHTYALKHFMASEVGKNLEETIKKHL